MYVIIDFIIQGIWGKQRVAEEVEAMIEDLQLVDKTNVHSGHLSGGQKRKLRLVFTYVKCQQDLVAK